MSSRRTTGVHPSDEGFLGARGEVVEPFSKGSKLRPGELGQVGQGRNGDLRN
jgi:hypothetical protein